ncbi:hypothetical protein [Pseudomaricurvus sp. HS19]|uniref:hypothetical protein n=1 Tax=Pseudomaricurvus sp. HS19 TaxID=2692626 RepID=UPI00136C0CE2|nr:hypothetical protein [Pseudomaricurvus sp. HS19]MYM64073.1 hypothetical protein [Pseudomaricurvus sp. HS19]
MPVLLLISVLLEGCSSAPAMVEKPVLERYRSSENYGALGLQAEGAAAREEGVDEFLSWAGDYAESRGINVKKPAELSQPDSLISVAVSEDSSLRATLYRHNRLVDELVIRGARESNAVLMIDEMLLLWHPPVTHRKSESHVPAYVLKPEFYEVGRDGFVKLVATNNANMNMGHQAWFQLESWLPTFTWEQFPRDWDLSSGLHASDFQQVRYEFRLATARELATNFNIFDRQLSAGFSFDFADFSVEAEVAEPVYTLTEKLPLCRQLMWTVRALFELNGSPRQTEWAGAYHMYPSMPEKPWYFRRKLSSGLAMYSAPGRYFYTVLSPRNPFAEECVYR